MEALRTAYERLEPEELPRLAFLLATTLDARLESPCRSLGEAAWRVLEDADRDAVEELARDWAVLAAAARERGAAAVDAALAARFGCPPLGVTRSEIEAVGEALARALAE